MGGEKRMPGNYCLRIRVIKHDYYQFNGLGFGSDVTTSACTVPSVASASTVCRLFRDVVAANRA